MELSQRALPPRRCPKGTQSDSTEQAWLAPCNLGKEAEEARGTRSLEKVAQLGGGGATLEPWLAGPRAVAPINSSLGKGYPRGLGI